MKKHEANTDPKVSLRTLSIIHIGLFLTSFIIGVIFFHLTEILPVSPLEQGGVMVYGYPIIALLAFFASNALFSKLTMKLLEEATLAKKLVGYQIASLIRWVLIEGPIFMGFILFFISGSSLYLAIAGSLLIYLFSIRPTAGRLERELQLKSEHLKQFRNQDQHH